MINSVAELLNKALGPSQRCKCLQKLLLKLLSHHLVALNIWLDNIFLPQLLLFVLFVMPILFSLLSLLSIICEQVINIRVSVHAGRSGGELGAEIVRLLAKRLFEFSRRWNR